ncbi:hypothetical protein [Candidatus Parabeggiatoa sp. HSG14]|uniref:hypothetical protein n=1 Tax=Candidatus Parabeggiatoa sp. HSG14 TaxID=3055593 RepID=UPI0025A88F4B|nr:hypothetical protein [Thiotrichales bacterium HSG14]
MVEFHKHLQGFVGELQQLLAENQDDERLIAAIRQKWPEKDLRQYFLLGLQNEINSQGSRKGLPRGLRDSGPAEDKGGRDNIPVGKIPVENTPK